MSWRPRTLGFGLALGLAGGCTSTALTIDEASCPEGGTQLTFQNFGEPFLGAYCDRCHDTARDGAPSAFRFTTPELVRVHAARIFVRAAGPNTTMPPGPEDPPADERDRLAEWLACGAP